MFVACVLARVPHSAQSTVSVGGGGGDSGGDDGQVVVNPYGQVVVRSQVVLVAVRWSGSDSGSRSGSGSGSGGG